MLSEESHLSDHFLVLAVDRELPPPDAVRVQSHLAACWACRSRKQEIEAAISEFIRMQRRNLDIQIPPADGPRALLKAQLAQLAQTQPTPTLHWVRLISWTLSWPTMSWAMAVA
jgi:anti-sigma factor RsiW